MSSTVPADGRTTLTPRTAAPPTSDWTPATVFRFNASSVPARHSGAPLCAAMTSPRYFSCAIPSAVSAAVNDNLSASPSRASLFLPASNREENIDPSTHQPDGSTSPNIQMPPIRCHLLHRKRNRTLVASPLDDAGKFCLEGAALFLIPLGSQRNPPRMDRPERQARHHDPKRHPLNQRPRPHLLQRIPCNARPNQKQHHRQRRAPQPIEP
jgi:hypothetical protein